MVTVILSICILVQVVCLIVNIRELYNACKTRKFVKEKLKEIRDATRTDEGDLRE